MRQHCEPCNRSYDDVIFMTTCPHNPVGGGTYCREHDLFDCKLHEQRAQVELAPFCDRHQAAIVRDLGFSPQDPWRAAIIATTICMFQAATINVTVQKKINGELERITELGCMACFLPGSFQRLMITGKRQNLKAMKELGDRWVHDAAQKKGESNE